MPSLASSRAQPVDLWVSRSHKFPQGIRPSGVQASFATMSTIALESMPLGTIG